MKEGSNPLQTPDRPAVYRFDGIEILPPVNSVRRNGRLIPVRARTFEVLLYLIEHRDRIVGKQELIDRIWGEVVISDNSVAQCVNELRQLLGDDRRSPRLIKTVAKVGYQFVGEADVSGEAEPVARKRVPLRTALFGAGALAVSGWMLWFFATPAPPGRGEAAWWRLDETSGITVRDAAGRMPPGRIAGAVARTPGRVRGAIEFTGADSRIEGRSAGLPAGSEPRSITLWMRARPNGDENGLFHYGVSQAPPFAASFGVFLKDDGRLAAGNRWRGGEVVGLTSLTGGDWHFVSAVYEGKAANVVRLSVDGRQEASGPLERPPDTRPGSWSIGKLLECCASLRGAIDDVRVYPRALHETEVRALHRCTSGSPDLLIDGRLPVFHLTLFGNRRPVEIEGGSIENKADFGGVQFATAAPDCPMTTIQGADLGQDLRIEADVLVPAGPGGGVTQAGPYFRSRKASPGDGLLGGTSAGYWVLLHSTGEVKIRTLNPHTVAAFSPPLASFDASIYHRLTAEIRGPVLRVWLDGGEVAFDQNGRRGMAVGASPLWNGPPRVGDNQGTAGIAFRCDPSGCEGGQKVRGIRVSRLR